MESRTSSLAGSLPGLKYWHPSDPSFPPWRSPVVEERLHLADVVMGGAQ